MHFKFRRMAKNHAARPLDERQMNQTFGARSDVCR
jgi:hypothetical protein